jgi:antitoxin StbD
MRAILSHYSASISELKRNPSKLIEKSNGETIAILNHNKPTAYLVPASSYERIVELLDDLELGRIVRERKNEKAKAAKVTLDEL